jgi:hypothetical protein
VFIPNKVTIPENSKVEVVEGASLSFLEGPKVLLAGAGALWVSGDNAIVIDGDTYPLPRNFKAEADATIEYKEGATAPSFSPSGAKAGRRRYGRRSFNLTLERHNERQTNMLIALVPVFAVVFASGAELGVIGVLSIGFSDATRFGRFLVSDLIVLVALFVIWSIVWKIQRATYAEPGQLELDGPAPAP